MSDPAGETQRSPWSFAREFPQIFGWGDAMISGLILLIGSIVTHETRGIEPSTTYATSLFYGLTNIAQVIAPILAVALGAAYWFSRRSTLPRGLRKGILLLFLALSISLLLLPFAEYVYTFTGVWQGGITCLILLALWGIGTIVAESRIQN